jgi:hypothetical protein
MKDDFTEIENELKNLRPAQPSPALRERIAGELDRMPSVSDGSSRKIVAWRRFTETPYNWLGLGLAAAAVLILFVRINADRWENRGEPVAQATPAPAKARSTSPGSFVPAGMTQVVYRTRNEGLQFPNGYAQPLRRVRYQTHETMQWRNPATGASLRVSYPSEKVVLIPVSGQ